MASNKESRALVREAERLYGVVRTKSGHYKIKAKGGEILVISFSPGTDSSERCSRVSFRKFKERNPNG